MSENAGLVLALRLLNAARLSAGVRLLQANATGGRLEVHDDGQRTGAHLDDVRLAVFRGNVHVDEANGVLRVQRRLHHSARRQTAAAAAAFDYRSKLSRLVGAVARVGDWAV